MAMTFDATLKDLARECPLGVLAEFDEPPSAPVRPLNVDLSAISKSADLVLGIGESLEECAGAYDSHLAAAAGGPSQRRWNPAVQPAAGTW